MCVLAVLILSITLLPWTGVRAQTGDGSFNAGVWRGSPVSTDGAFAYCGMQAFFGRRESPVALTVGLDRLNGWTLAVRSDRFQLPEGQIRAGIAFDDEAPVDIRGEVVSPTMVSFRFPSTDLLDRHLGSRKLVLLFSDTALPFALSGFEEATRALQSCVAANAAEQPAAEAAAMPPAVTAAVTTTPRQPEPADPRLFSEVVGPMIVGFVGSVTMVIFIGGVSFQIARIRARSRYLRLWSAEYRSTVTRPLSVSLLDSRAAA